MKHLYLLLTVCLYCSITTNAQTKYWIGLPAGDNWNDPANWSNSSGGAPGADVPNGSSYNVVFNQNAVVNVDLAAISLNSLTVTGNATVRLYTPAQSSTITLLSTNAAAPALQVDLGSTLEDSCSTAGTEFITRFANDAQGLINGTWSFFGVTGTSGPPALPAGIAYAQFPSTTTYANFVRVNGTIKQANDFSFFDCSVPAYLYFDNGSKYWVARNGGTVPRATWHANSTLSVTGIKTGGPTIGLPPSGQGIGHLTIDCSEVTGTVTFPLVNNLVIAGNLQVLNTNNQNLVLGTTSGGSTVNYTVQGNLEISPNASITLGGTNMSYSYAMQVNGSFMQTGGHFNLRNNTGTATQPTVLRIKGNITQSAGTFGCANTTTSTTAELFVVELNGTGNQNISLSSNTIDNSTNQVVLRLNNAAGATLLSPLSVGKMSWDPANKGNLTTTTTNVLTISNTDLSDPLVVNGASNGGYVNGPVRRATASNSLFYSFPTGKGGVLRACEVKPTTTTASEYEAEYFSSAYSGTTVQAPLTAVSNQEYWNIGRISGSDAVVRLTLAGAVPGASAADTLVVAHYTGGTWTDARGTKLTPGNTSTGSVESAILTSFSPFTFGYTSSSSLPIYLLNFTARKDGNTAKLNWTITENSTPQRFEVLRSTNGTNFTHIGTLTGAARKLTYDFTDNALPAGTVYYRLRMIDIDGSAELTKIVAVMNGSKGVVITSMMPTLVTNRARLNISSSEKVAIQLLVTDIYGRTIQQQVHTLTTGNQEIWLNLGTLPAGTYQVTGYLATGERTTSIRFIKQ